MSTSPRLSQASNLKVTAVIDNMSIELFFDNGETVMTEIFFPEQPIRNFSAEGNEFSLSNLKINQVKLN